VILNLLFSFYDIWHQLIVILNFIFQDLAPAKHRCAMVKQAIKSSKWIRYDNSGGEGCNIAQSKKTVRIVKSDTLS
jgi:nicotinic acid mononucleotide adenylyltransferase